MGTILAFDIFLTTCLELTITLFVVRCFGNVVCVVACALFAGEKKSRGTGEGQEESFASGLSPPHALC